MPNGDVSSMTVVTKAALKTGALRIVTLRPMAPLRTHRRGWLANCRRHREKIVAAYSDEFFGASTVQLADGRGGV